MNITVGMKALAQAIARMEGFYKFSSLPARLHNPGDLMFAGQHLAKLHEVKGVDGKVRVYAEFPDDPAGWLALYNQITKDAGRGLTLESFIHKWAPASDGNDPEGYLAYVVRAINASPGTLVRDIIA